MAVVLKVENRQFTATAVDGISFTGSMVAVHHSKLNNVFSLGLLDFLNKVCIKARTIVFHLLLFKLINGDHCRLQKPCYESLHVSNRAVDDKFLYQILVAKSL